MTLIETLSQLPSFIWLTLAGGLLIALSAAPLGVFMVWQRQSYFGATIAHSALLGVSLGLLLSIDLTLAVVGVSVLVALGIHWLSHHTELSSDTLLGILAHSSLALGLVILSLADSIQVDVMSYLFGDILTITPQDIALMASMVIAVALFFMTYWKALLNITLNGALAQVEGVNVKKVKLLYTLLLAVMIALSMKVVGVLLITALLIIPTAAARHFSHSPEQMLGWSLLFSVISLLVGMVSSFLWDVPTGPTIVLVATVIFLAARLKPLKA